MFAVRYQHIGVNLITYVLRFRFGYQKSQWGSLELTNWICLARRLPQRESTDDPFG